VKNINLILVFVLAPILLLGQSKSIDSLKVVIASQQNDSTKVESLLELSKLYYDSDPSEAIKISEEATKLGREIGYLRGAAYGLKNAGIAFYYQGNYIEAISHWKRALAVFDTIGDKQGVANILSNIGAVYYAQGDYNNAIDHHLRSLSVAEEIQDTIRIVTSLLNIGVVYLDKPITYNKALDYSLKALKLSEMIGYDEAIATSSVNIGEIYYNTGDYDKALTYYQKAKDAMQGADGSIYVMASIGKAYTKKGQYSDAVLILQESIELANQLNSQPNKAHALVALAETYNLIGKRSEAIKAYQVARNIATEIKSLKILEQIFQGLNQLYSERGTYDSAYKYQHLLLNIKDSIYNAETEEILNNQMFNFQIEKKQNEINLLTKDKELQELDFQKQRVIRNLIGAGLISVMIFLIVVMSQKKRISKEKERSEELLLNILPKDIADELKENGKSEARNFNEVTVVFTDFKEFTDLAQKLTAKQLVEEVNYYFKAFDEIITRYNIEKIKTIGDAYMAASGLPNPETHSVHNVVHAALEMQKVVLDRHELLGNENSKLFNMRIGIHTGPVVAGIVGVKKFQYDIWGDTVNTASRMESSGEVGMINISQATYEKVKDSSEFEFESRGKIEVKGKGSLEMFFVRLKS